MVFKFCAQGALGLHLRIFFGQETATPRNENRPNAGVLFKRPWNGQNLTPLALALQLKLLLAMFVKPRVAGLYVNDFAISALLSSRLIHNPLYSPV